MKLRMAGLIALVCLLTLPPHSVRADDVVRYLVGRLSAPASDAAMARGLEDQLVLELGKRHGLRVATPSELEQTLHFSTLKSELGCNEVDACVAEVKRQMSVSKMVSGTLGRLGKDLVLTLRVVDTSTSSVDRRSTAQAPDEAGLRAQIGKLVDELVGSANEAPTFRLAEGEALRLAVMPLAARGVDDATASSMTQILSAELNQIGGVEVLSQDDIRAMLDKVALESEVGCTDNSQCVVEIGAALGLSKLISGAVGKVGASYVISLQLIDTREASVQNRVVESFEGDVGELKNAIKLAAYQVVGADYASHRGALDLSFNVDEAKVLFRGRTETSKDGKLDLTKLEPGRYPVRIFADSDKYIPLQTDLYVAPDATNVRTFDLERRPVWYRSWWFWTITGAVVAGGGVTTGVLMANRAPTTGSGVVTVEGK